MAESHIALADVWGLDVRGYSAVAARALLGAKFDHTLDKGNTKAPTQKQVAFLGKYGLDARDLTRAEVNAAVDSIMLALNLESIETQGLAPGETLVIVSDPLRDVHVISSIQPDGTVCLKGGKGARAWARNLRRTVAAWGTTAGEGDRPV